MLDFIFFMGLNFTLMAQQCAPEVAPPTLAALVRVESNHNPFAIGVVGGHVQQPKSLAEAVRTAERLNAAGKNFSVGIAQVNRYNLAKYGLTYSTAFEPCSNLRAGARILQECYARATRTYDNTRAALHAALSCYYSGNFTRGFRPDKPGDISYVDKVLAAAAADVPRQLPVVPSLTDTPRPTSGAVSATLKRPQVRVAEGGPVLLHAERIARAQSDQVKNPQIRPHDEGPVLLRAERATTANVF